MQRIRMRQGFTLIELLIVVAIIGILASIVLVSLNNARIRAAHVSFQTSMKSAASAAVLCRDDGGEILDGGAAGTDICDLNTSYGQWPSASKCGSFGAFTVFNGGAEDWEFENSCDSSCDADDNAAGGEGCNANGCTWGGC